MRIVSCFRENLLRDALDCLLESQDGNEVVASAHNASTAISAARVHLAEIVVVVADTLSDDDLRRLNLLGSAPPFAILVISGIPSTADSLGFRCDKVIARSASGQHLLKELEDLAAKKPKPALAVRERPASTTVKALTAREEEIATKVAEGLPNRDIAIELGLAEQTVKNMVSTVMQKMRCRNRTQVALHLSGAAKSRTGRD